jgi:hypothetical protein
MWVLVPCLKVIIFWKCLFQDSRRLWSFRVHMKQLNGHA